MLGSINLFVSSLLSSPINRLIFAFFSGLLLALANPAFGFGFIAWFALLPLFILIKSSKSFLMVFVESFIFALAYHVLCFFWLFTLHPLTWQNLSLEQSFVVSVLAWFLPSIFHSLLTAIFSLIAKLFFEFQYEFSNRRELTMLQSLALALIWAVFHHKLALHIFKPLDAFSVPINFLAYSQYQNIYLIQAANIIGAIGIEIILVFFNLNLSNLFNIEQFKNTRAGLPRASLNVKSPHLSVRNPINVLANLSISIALVLFLTASGYIRLLNYQPAAKQLNFALVQANMSAENIRGAEINTEELIEIHNSLTNKNISTKKDILIWPEGVVSTVKDKFKNLGEPLKDLAAVFIYGTYSYDYKDKKTFNSIAVKDYSLIVNEAKQPELLEASAEEAKELAAKAASVDIDQQIYKKRILVPFGEYTPFKEWLPKSLHNLAKSVLGAGFDAAEQKQAAIKTNLFTMGSSICFELLFPELIREQVMDSAELLVNLNDLSWFKSPMVKKQFLAVAVFRAVENQKDLLLSGNAGYSALISSKGELSYSQQPFEAGTYEGTVSLNNRISVYTKYGW